MPSASKHDNFLVDAVKPKSRPPRGGISYVDGFRFGFGFFVSGIVVTLILGGLTWAAMLLLHLH